MGQRRMFSNRIANSAKFLQMPAEAQLLYFHMILRADDDGVVEAYPLMKLLGSAPDVFKVLVIKGFIRQLNEDQVIVITDWLEHNVIRADRKVNSIYLHLLKEQAPDMQIIEPKPRSDVVDNSNRIGGQSTVSISQVKLSKDKTSKENTNSELKARRNVDIFPKEEYTKVTESYKQIKQVSPAKSEWLPILREIKLIFKAGRTSEQIIQTMRVCEANYDDWSMATVRLKIADVVAGKLSAKTNKFAPSVGIIGKGARDI